MKKDGNQHSAVSEPDHEWQQAVKAVETGDLEGALFVFRKIARTCPAALPEIGNIYELGGRDVERNDDEALRWYERSIEKTNDSRAHLAIGRICLKRKRSRDELERAIYHFSLLDDEPGALFALGMIYEQGLGTAVDWDEALTYYERSVDLGHIMAKKRCAVLEIKKGKLVKGLLNWWKASLEIFKTLNHNPEDTRLRVAAKARKLN